MKARRATALFRIAFRMQQHTLRVPPALPMRRAIHRGGLIALVAVLLSALPLAAREDNHRAVRSLPRDDSVIAAQVNDIPAGLETLPADRLAKLAVWLERGIRFEGATWDAHTVGLAMTALDITLRQFDGDWDKLKPLLGLKASASLVYDDDTSKCPSGRRANCALPWNGRIHFNTSSLTLNEFLHENGHVVDWFLQKEHGASGAWWSTTGLLGLGWTPRSDEARLARLPAEDYEAMYDDAQRDAPYSQASRQEDFADSFVAWVLGPKPPEPYRALSPRRHRALNVAFEVLPE